MGKERTDEIISFARDISKSWGNNAIAIAERCGFTVILNKSARAGAKTIKLAGYPTVISIYGCGDINEYQVLCAHELGHALLHEDGVNNFKGSYKTIIDNTEYEANLFAVALLFDDDDFNMPISRMSNYLLKGILDYNIKNPDL